MGQVWLTVEELFERLDRQADDTQYVDPRKDLFRATKSSDIDIYTIIKDISDNQLFGLSELAKNNNINVATFIYQFKKYCKEHEIRVTTYPGIGVMINRQPR